MIKLINSEPVLREASLNGAMMFAAFSAFWTSLIFLLESPHYHLGAEAAGLFGLVGIGGALAAPQVGKLADRKGPKFAIGIGIIAVTISYILFFLFGFKIGDWGALGSFLGSYSYGHFGWVGVCIFGFATQVIALIVHKTGK